jgi:Na+-driven multidrug efflux pump
VIVPINVALAAALIIPFGVNGAAAASAVALVLRGSWLALAVRRRLGVDTSLLALLPRRPAFLRALSVPSGLRTPAE